MFQPLLALGVVFIALSIAGGTLCYLDYRRSLIERDLSFDD